MSTEKTYYDEHGYCVIKGLIPQERINEVLDVYKSKILPSKKSFYRQSSGKWEKNRLNSYGYCIQSFRDVHDLPVEPELTKASRDIFCSNEIKAATTKVTGCKDHNLVQSMLFDLNAATAPHQDRYYLDSVPHKKLFGVWFALEDIKEESGQFYVLPGSHKIDFALDSNEKFSNDFYLEKIKNYMADKWNKVVTPNLKKGDVLFWNSATVHGALPTKDEQYSRKSLTAHYIPENTGFGSLHTETPVHVDYETYNGMKLRKISSAYTHYSLKNKLRAEVSELMWKYPKVKQLYMQAKNIINR